MEPFFENPETDMRSLLAFVVLLAPSAVNATCSPDQLTGTALVYAGQTVGGSGGFATGFARFTNDQRLTFDLRSSAGGSLPSAYKFPLDHYALTHDPDASVFKNGTCTVHGTYILGGEVRDITLRYPAGTSPKTLFGIIAAQTVETGASTTLALTVQRYIGKTAP
jgi:hypothetical protein